MSRFDPWISMQVTRFEYDRTRNLATIGTACGLELTHDLNQFYAASENPSGIALDHLRHARMTGKPIMMSHDGGGTLTGVAYKPRYDGLSRMDSAIALANGQDPADWKMWGDRYLDSWTFEGPQRPPQNSVLGDRGVWYQIRARGMIYSNGDVHLHGIAEQLLIASVGRPLRDVVSHPVLDRVPLWIKGTIYEGVTVELRD